MIIGVILVGSGIGAVSAVAALILGHSIWMALLIYSTVGALSTLAGAAALALRTADDCKKGVNSHALSQPQRG